MGAIKPGGGVGTPLPAAPAAVLADAGAPQSLVVLDDEGEGTALPIADVAGTMLELNLARRRPAGSSALLWECDESSSPLASTGSVACSLADAGAAVIGYTEPLSPLTSTALRCAGASTSEVIGGAGVIPSTATVTAVTLWALVVIRAMPSVAGCIIGRDYGTTGGAWSDPYGTLLDILPGGAVRALAPFGASPVADALSSGTGEVEINRLHLVGFTYSGTTLRVWVDGRQVATKSVASPLTWGTDGSWHLGGNGGGNGLDGSVLRAGVETSAWSQTTWATLYRQTMGAAS